MPALMRPWGHLHYADRPGAGPTVVFLNALGTDLRMWQGVIDRLPDIRALRMDKRGHGLSATPGTDWTLDDLVDDALALMDHLGVARALIAGCSIGGMIAQAVAVRAPDRVAGLFLSNTAMKVGTAEGWQDRIAAVTTQGLKGFAPQIMARWFAPSFRDSTAALPWLTLLQRGDDAGYIATCRVLARADLTAISPAIACPTLLIGGTADASTPEALVRATAAAIPGARVAIIAGSGHIPAIDNPDVTAGLLAGFLDGLR
jgi:3-oxoadipate enol-lactonase